MTTIPAPAKPRKSGWTPERRRKQAENIKRWKPWAKSTGPRTAEGKSRARYNAWKHGLRGVHHRRLIGAMRTHSAFLRYLEVWLRHEKIKNSNKRTIGGRPPSPSLRGAPRRGNPYNALPKDGLLRPSASPSRGLAEIMQKTCFFGVPMANS